MGPHAADNAGASAAESDVEVEMALTASKGTNGEMTDTDAKADGKKKGKAPKEPPAPSVSFFKLFAFADTQDYLLMALGTFGAVVHGAALPTFFLFFGKLINNLGNQEIDNAQQYALDFVYLGLVVMFSSWAEVFGWMQTGERQSARIRSLYLRALMKQEIGFFDQQANSGELVGRVSSDVLLVQDAISEKVGNFLHFMATFFAGFIIGFTSIWQLALVILGCVPLIAVVGAVYTVILTGVTNKAQEAYARAGGVAEQAISQIRTVYSFAAEEKTLQAYGKALETTIALGIRGGFAKGAGLGCLYGILFCIWALEFWYASTLIGQEHPVANGGQALTTMFAVIIGGLSLGQAAPNLTAFAKGKAAAYHIFQMIERVSAIDSDNLDGATPASIEGRLDLQDVHFAYPSRPDAPIFQGFSLHIPAGKTMALVGASGSGKSTVVGLIERFYDPSTGSVMLDGIDIKRLQLKWLRQQLGLVSQEPALFATTIKANILYGKEGGTEEEMFEAAKAANCHNFIMGLPQKYETQVGERGVQMSGGQKQRIAIARAILKNPRILLLDEATSALDSESERIVQEALDNLMVGRTTVVIAHRLSTIRGAHQIAVVSRGTICEMGTHDELMGRGENGAYVQLTKMQDLARERDSAAVAADAKRTSTDKKPLNMQVSALSELSEDGKAAAGKDGAIVAHEENLPPLTREGWLRLIQLSAPEWLNSVMATLGAVGAGAFNPLFGLFLSSVIADYYDTDFSRMKRNISHWCFVFIGMGAASGFVYILQHYNFGIMGEHLTKRVREAMFQAILRNEVAWFDRDANSSGAVASRLATDATLVRAAAGDRISVIVQNLSLLIIAFTIALILQWKMALVVIATFPLLIVSAVVEQAFLKGFAGDQKAAHEQASMVASEAVGNVRTVAAFGAEDRVLALFNTHLEAPLKRATARGLIAGAVYGSSQCIMYSAFGLGLWYGSTLVPDEANFGDILKVFLVLIITSFAIAETLTLAPDLAKGGTAVRSVFAVIDRVPAIVPDDEESIKPASLKGHIQLKHVRFAYPSRPDVVLFDNFSLNIEAGKTVALVGSSGSGKSSVIALIERFYDPLAGQVLIDGVDLKSYHVRSLREHIGLVSQEPSLFSTTIRDNILYGRDNATEAEVVAAAQAANCHNFITALPEGYDTEVGERGVQLSGGQKQRVAIARAVLKNPAILLLDEATSALDTESEKVVQDALDNLMVGRTTVVIAHRLSTIRGADSIAVVQEGKIIEMGSHAELIAQTGGAYRALVNLQQTTGGAPI
eukprot:TRINITY_DN20981_c0_g1_i1.p1 TRINITY_DN20981_c0_g1~~TRINITY_DN20981_c0_g1_i1.p1  ORF type:complete len:1281 (-),score=259.90 TRINITY_DN20981_c0_g1_i1:445-4287(-)